MCKGTIIYRGTTQLPVNKIFTDTFRYVTYTRRQCLLRQNSGTLFIIHRSSFIQQCSSRGKFGYLSERKKAHSRWPLLSDRKQYLIEHDHSFWFVWFDWFHVCNLFIILGMLVGNVKGFLSLIFSSWYFQIIRNFTYCKHFASTKPRNL